MGLFQNLLKTYNVCEDVVGIVGRDFDGQENERKTLLPVFHTILSSQICVTLDGNGNLIDAKRDEKDTAIVIPCTFLCSQRKRGGESLPARGAWIEI